MIKSPLRYPGGKSRALMQIEAQVINDFKEFREPFVGGGSVFIYFRQKYPHIKFWINDLNPEVFLFWQIAQSHLDELVVQVKKTKLNYRHGRDLFKKLTTCNVTKLSELERAVRFFVLNRITFSGTIEAGGYSEEAFQKRFTASSIDRLAKLGLVLAGIKITNLDFADVIAEPGDNPFIFLDPPYHSATKSKLYGNKGAYHTCFDHQRFAQSIQNCPHDWLITYDDSEIIRELFANSFIEEWKLQYGMNNYKQNAAAKGNELFIRNYCLDLQQLNTR